jgi:DNA (cytosine-5)-methyltransferase 1
MTQLTFGSLFAGIGGFDLGFERAGMACKWQVEIDPYCQKVLSKHWPGVTRHDDVRTWPTADAGYVDVICGGFPCQDISYAGKGAGLNGERSGLFYEVIRIVSEMGPRIVVLENVAALLTRGMGDVLGSLASIGYDAEWNCIPAAAVGAPHIRDRVFVIAWPCADTDSHSVKKQDGKSQQPTVQTSRRDNACRLRDDVSNAYRSRFKDAQGQRSAARSSRRHQLISNDWWDIEPAVGRVADGVSHRVDRLRGLGNAVVPQVAEYIGRIIAEACE